MQKQEQIYKITRVYREILENFSRFIHNFTGHGQFTLDNVVEEIFMTILQIWNQRRCFTEDNCLTLILNHPLMEVQRMHDQLMYTPSIKLITDGEQFQGQGIISLVDDRYCEGTLQYMKIINLTKGYIYIGPVNSLQSPQPHSHHSHGFLREITPGGHKTYNGSFKEGKRQGFGEETFKPMGEKGNIVVYRGGWKGDLRGGVGEEFVYRRVRRGKTQRSEVSQSGETSVGDKNSESNDVKSTTQGDKQTNQASSNLEIISQNHQNEEKDEKDVKNEKETIQPSKEENTKQKTEGEEQIKEKGQQEIKQKAEQEQEIKEKAEQEQEIKEKGEQEQEIKEKAEQEQEIKEKGEQQEQIKQKQQQQYEEIKEKDQQAQQKQKMQNQHGQQMQVLEKAELDPEQFLVDFTQQQLQQKMKLYKKITKTFKSVYKGNWVNGQKQDQKAVYVTKYGIYVGGFSEDKKNGQGKMIYKGAAIYEGEWKNDLIEGTGKYIDQAGNVYTGSFESGQYNGQGTMEYANGDRYEGQWRNGQKHGQGVYTFADDDYYDGAWERDRAEGKGTSMTNGNFFEGEFSKGVRHGLGTETLENGDEEVALWKNGIKKRIVSINGEAVEEGGEEQD